MKKSDISFAASISSDSAAISSNASGVQPGAGLAVKTKTKEAVAGNSLSERDEQILKVATTVFARRGYRNTDVQEIADILDIGKATIYRAFGTKEELFFATVDYGMRNLSLKMAQTKSESAGSDSAMEECIRTFLAHFAEHPELVELLMQERSEFRDRDSHSYIRHWLSKEKEWIQSIGERKTQGLFRADLEAQDFIDAVSAICYGTIFINYFSRREVNLESTARAVTEIVLFGVLTDDERSRRLAKESKRHGQ